MLTGRAISSASGFGLSLYRPPAVIPWLACRDSMGRWCVRRYGAWNCVVWLTVTGARTADDRVQEAHACEVADALNRVYSR